ncbi:hypothetical protein D3C73_1289290 [compost metagenome]
MKFVVAVEYANTKLSYNAPDGTVGFAILTLTTTGVLKITAVDKPAVTTTTGIYTLHLTGVSYYF